jgi:hypothetical protein
MAERVMRRTLYLSVVLGCSKTVTVPLVCTWSIGFGPLYVGSSFEMAGIKRTLDVNLITDLVIVCFSLGISPHKTFVNLFLPEIGNYKNIRNKRNVEIHVSSGCKCPWRYVIQQIVSMGNKLSTMILIMAAIVQ